MYGETCLNPTYEVRNDNPIVLTIDSNIIIQKGNINSKMQGTYK